MSGIWRAQASGGSGDDGDPVDGENSATGVVEAEWRKRR